MLFCYLRNQSFLFNLSTFLPQQRNTKKNFWQLQRQFPSPGKKTECVRAMRSHVGLASRKLTDSVTRRSTFVRNAKETILARLSGRTTGFRKQLLVQFNMQNFL
jgi:hypothetical protein